VAVSVDGQSWEDLDTVFSGNFDRDTKVVGRFPTEREARYVRIMPQTWSGHMSMRAGVLACATATTTPTITTTSSPTTPPEVSAVGDPHLVNLRGERFDIYEPGSFVLVQLPRGAEPASTLLLVEAGAAVVGGPCSVFFQTVTISGAWTNQTEPLLFTADPHSKPSSTFHSVQWMQFGLVGVKVIHWRKEVDFLDIYVKNVGQTGHTVGGLLGSDDHKELAPMPRECSLSHGRAARPRLESSVAEARS